DRRTKTGPHVQPSMNCCARRAGNGRRKWYFTVLGTHLLEERESMASYSRMIQLRAAIAVALGAAIGIGAAGAQPTIGPVFVIAMENHNWTQPGSQTSPGQIFGNPAAPYINSLVTPGNPNSQFVSYASNYQNAGIGIHPSEPNYIWAE